MMKGSAPRQAALILMGRVPAETSQEEIRTVPPFRPSQRWRFENAFGPEKQNEDQKRKNVDPHVGRNYAAPNNSIRRISDSTQFTLTLPMPPDDGRNEGLESDHVACAGWFDPDISWRRGTRPRRRGQIRDDAEGDDPVNRNPHQGRDTSVV